MLPSLQLPAGNSNFQTSVQPGYADISSDAHNVLGCVYVAERSGSVDALSTRQVPESLVNAGFVFEKCYVD